jgi:signal transduction histidine kinase
MVRLVNEPFLPLPPVLGDRVQLQQVLLNLVVNAMDAVRDSAPHGREITVRAQPAGNQVEVAVSDTGPGIPAEDLARIFEPFFTTKPHGMGMGLPISYRIVQSHGGNLQAQNNAASGATFTFTLPIALGKKGSDA